jgi:hypothetical protein
LDVFEELEDEPDPAEPPPWLPCPPPLPWLSGGADAGALCCGVDAGAL